MTGADRLLSVILRRSLRHRVEAPTAPADRVTRHHGHVVIKQGRQTKLYSYYLIDHLERDS